MKFAFMNSLGIWALIVGACSLTSAFAQGTVLFMNDDRALVKRWAWLYDPTITIVPTGGASVQLAYAPAGTPYIFPRGAESEADWLAQNAGWTMGPTAPFVSPGL